MRTDREFEIDAREYKSHMNGNRPREDMNCEAIFDLNHEILNACIHMIIFHVRLFPTTV